MSLKQPASWDLLDEDCAAIDDWVDADNENGVSEVAPAGSGEQVQVLGIAMALDTIYFNPSPVLVEIV